MGSMSRLPVAVLVGMLVVVAVSCSVVEEAVLGIKRGTFESLEAELEFIDGYVAGLVDGVVEDYEIGEQLLMWTCSESGGLLEGYYEVSVVPRSESVLEVYDGLLAEMTERSGPVKLALAPSEEQLGSERVPLTRDDVGQLGFSARIGDHSGSIVVDVRRSEPKPGIVLTTGTGCYEPEQVESEDPDSLEREEGVKLVGPRMFRSDFDDGE